MLTNFWVSSNLELTNGFQLWTTVLALLSASNPYDWIDLLLKIYLESI